jgi:hypothetical protein
MQRKNREILMNEIERILASLKKGEYIAKDSIYDQNGRKIIFGILDDPFILKIIMEDCCYDWKYALKYISSIIKEVISDPKRNLGYIAPVFLPVKVSQGKYKKVLVWGNPDNDMRIKYLMRLDQISRGVIKHAKIKAYNWQTELIIEETKKEIETLLPKKIIPYIM